jgi:hypothetical protein
MTRSFKLLSGDASGIPAIYFRKSDSFGRDYDVYELNLWEDLDSSAVATHGKYNVQAGTVTLVHSDVNVAALRCCGLRLDAAGIVSDSGDVVATSDNPDQWNAVLVECLWQYGAKDVAEDCSGNNLRALIRQARSAL